MLAPTHQSWDRRTVARRSLPLLAFGMACLLVSGMLPPEPGKAHSLDTPIDVLLGKNGRKELAEAVKNRQYETRTFEWQQYAAWGKELLVHGQVKSPPVGQAPSKPLSQYYRCVHCHNLVREDPKLTVQDPEAREKLIRDAKAKPQGQDGPGIAMTSATTLWGVVNREQFYNGYYERYRNLRLPNGNPMNSKNLADAVVICCQYCSTGRFPVQWELDSILAALWDIELRLKELDLPEETAKRILSDLEKGDAQAVAAARDLIRRSYLRVASAQVAAAPKGTKGDADLYEDGTTVKGDAKAGKLLYRSACAGCHGTDIHISEGPRLVESEKLFHRYVLKGTAHDDKVYMPLFTTERLSRRQLADIRVHLQALANEP